MEWTKKREGLKDQVARRHLLDWKDDVTMSSKDPAAEALAQAAQTRLEAAMAAKRRQLEDQLRIAIETQRRRLQMARAGHENAVIAARKVLAQLYRLGGVNVETAFRDFDRNNSQFLDLDEFLIMLRVQAKISTAQLSDADLRCIFHAVDADHSGLVDMQEFRDWVMRELARAKGAGSVADAVMRARLKVEMDEQMAAAMRRLEEQMRERMRKELKLLRGKLMWNTTSGIWRASGELRRRKMVKYDQPLASDRSVLQRLEHWKQVGLAGRTLDAIRKDHVRRRRVPKRTMSAHLPSGYGGSRTGAAVAGGGGVRR